MPASPIKQAIGYIRVSTLDQADHGVSLDAQSARVKAWCVAHDYELVHLFTDAGISGKRADNRPGLQDALQAACKARGAAIVVYSLSRLARSTKDAIHIAERLDRAGADLVSLSESIDTTTAAGKMIFRMLAVLAEFERDLVSERTRAALAHKRANGQRIGRHLPFGFRLDEDGKTLVPIEIEQDVITSMRAMRGRGHSYARIAKQLTRAGIPTKNRGTWASENVRKILMRDDRTA